MTLQASNRYLAATLLYFDNPITGLRYFIDQIIGRENLHYLKFGEIKLNIRSGSTDLKVIRSCLLGEFEQAMSVTAPDAKFIVDAGGYIGLVSVLLAKRFPRAHVICLEPSSENFSLARANCAPYENITVIKMALGAKSGKKVLHDRGTGQWGFSITPGAQSVGAELEEVEVISLIEVMERFDSERVDFLKLDIEGAEYEILEGSTEWIDVCDVLFVELHERIRPGVEQIYTNATKCRREICGSGEKRLSVRH